MISHVLGLERRRALVLTLVLTLLTGLVVLSAPPTAAYADTITVNSTADTDSPDASNCDGEGTCTLRDAIEAANDDADASFIELAAGATYQLAHGDLEVSEDLTVFSVGARATIEQTGSDGIFAVDGPSFTVNNLVLTGGDNDYGGAIEAWYDFDVITVTNSVITGNEASYGGGIYIEGEGGSQVLHVEDSEISGNSAGSEGGGIFGYGFNQIRIINSTVEGNDAEYGGGLYAECDYCDDEAEVVVLSGASFLDNTATEDGGGVYLWGWSYLGVSQSTFAGNGAETGSALYLDDWNASSDHVQLRNSTFSGNEAAADGGAIYVEEEVGDTELLHLTIADNDGGGLAIEQDTELEVANSILDQCVADGAVASRGHNIEVGDTCGLDAAGDQTDTDPMLAALADNGGMTLTRAIGAGSPAYQAADAGLCTNDDQRGVERKDACDIGAFELTTTPVGPPMLLDCSTVTPVTFPDVSPSSTHGGNIGCAAGAGIFLGRVDGTFAPQRDVTRGQVASTIFRALQNAGLDLEEAPDSAAADTAGNTHRGAIGALTELGVVTNYNDGTFRPTESVNRAQLASLIARASAELGVDVTEVTPTFSDVGPGVHAGNIGWAAQAGIIEGYGDDTFRPGNPATRAQTASMLVRWLSSVPS